MGEPEENDWALLLSSIEDFVVVVVRLYGSIESPKAKLGEIPSASKAGMKTESGVRFSGGDCPLSKLKSPCRSGLDVRL